MNLPAQTTPAQKPQPKALPLDARLRTALSPRRATIIGAAATAAVFLGFFGWGMGTEINGAVLAGGQIQVDQNKLVIQHPDGGVVAAVLVKEAQIVAAGDVLIRLDGADLTSQKSILQGQLSEVRARHARLEAERDDLPAVAFAPDLLELAQSDPQIAAQIEGQKRLFTARVDTLTQQIAQLNRRTEQIAAQVDGGLAQIDAQKAQLVLIEAQLKDRQALLDKGLAQSADVSDLQREVARLRGVIGELTSNNAVSEGKATEVELEILRLQAVRREEAAAQLRELGPQELELTEKLRAVNDRIARLEIRAPSSGIVMGLAVTAERAVIRPADALMYVVPQDRALIIVAQVSPYHVDEVHVGQAVTVVFPEYSARTTPVLQGRLTTISADAFTDQNAQASFYRAQIELDPGEREKLGSQILLPGMPVQAMIQTEARSPMAYLLKPLTDYFNTAFRES